MAKVPSLEVDSNPSDLKGFANRVAKLARDIAAIFRRLTFEDNFFCEVWEGTILASTEKEIPHKLGVVPQGFIAIKDTSGALRPGTTEWTRSKVYIENAAALSDAEVKIVILG